MAKKETKTPASAPAPVIAYKGFNPGFDCRGFKYELGKTYTQDGKVELCGNGFHACEYPLSVLEFYSAGSSVFAVVEQSGEVVKDENKQASSVITLKASLDLPGLIKAAVEYTFARVKKTKKGTNSGTRGAASNSGDYGAASNSGTRGAASNSGTRGAASNSGYSGAASNSGYSGAASNSGDYGAASNSGKDGVAAAFGLESKAKSSLGGAVIVAWYDAKAERKRFTVGYAGENGIKADVWYVADQYGELIEA